ncbi:MAG: hypothetical protein ACLQU4_02650 [Limisphaerales bacterium]
MDKRFDIETFIQGCVGLSYVEVIAKAQEQERWAESMTAPHRRGAPKNRAAGTSRFAAELRSLLFYLYHGTKPMTGDFILYEPLVRSLVERGEFKPEALDIF